MSDIDGWVIAARSGEAWAFERLWLAYSGRVYGYLRSRGIADAEDVASEVFLAAFCGLPTLVGDGAAFRAWLFTIAHHKGVDELRRVGREGAMSSPTKGLDATEPLRTDEQVLGDAQLVDLLASLPESQREVIWLRFVVDLSLEDVARVTGRGVGAVKQLQRRGIARLRRHLDSPILVEAVSPPAILTIVESR